MNLKGRWSLTVLIACITAMVVIVLAHPIHNRLSWDTLGYYLYLPAHFIYGDLGINDISWLENIVAQYNSTATLYQINSLPEGGYAMRYPGGLALLNSPFFFLADALAPVLGYSRDGFSLPYQIGWVVGGFFYGILGLIFTRKILLFFFDDKIAAITLLTLFAGTNLIEQLSTANGGVHNFAFGLFALCLWLTIRWHQKPNIFYAAFIGIVVGLITICRPTEIIIVLIPLLWGAYNRESLQEKLNLLKSKKTHVLALGFGVIVGGLPQMIYWYAITGTPLYYSYHDHGVGFDFGQPHTYEFLFSFRKGWFIYTPVMLLAIFGIIKLRKDAKPAFLATLMYTVIAIYVASSWSVWWYAGGSYSSRSMVSAYSLLAIPLGFSILSWWSHSKRFILAILFILMALNLFQFWQFSRGIISGDRMTKAYYQRVFLKTSVSEEDKKLLLVERSVEPYEYLKDEENFRRRPFYHREYDNVEFEYEQLATDPLNPNNSCLLMDSNYRFTHAVRAPFNEISRGEYAWIRAKVRFFVPENAEPPLLVIHFNYKDKPYKYVTSENQLPNLEKGKWETVSMDYMTPEVRTEKDPMLVYLWYRGNNPIYVDDLSIEIFEPKK